MGISLWYLKSSDPIYKICPAFGVVPSTIVVWLDYGLEVLLRVLKNAQLPYFAIEWPKEVEIRASAALLLNKRAHGVILDEIFSVMDGGRVPCVTYSNATLDNAYWEEFTQQHEVTKLSVWSFTSVWFWLN